MKFNFYRLQNPSFKNLLSMLLEGSEDECGFAKALASMVEKSLGAGKLTKQEEIIISPIVNHLYSKIMACFAYELSDKTRQKIAETLDKSFKDDLQGAVNSAKKILESIHAKKITADILSAAGCSTATTHRPITDTLPLGSSSQITIYISIVKTEGEGLHTPNNIKFALEFKSGTHFQDRLLVAKKLMDRVYTCFDRSNADQMGTIGMQSAHFRTIIEIALNPKPTTFCTPFLESRIPFETSTLDDKDKRMDALLGIEVIRVTNPIADIIHNYTPNSSAPAITALPAQKHRSITIQITGIPEQDAQIAELAVFTSNLLVSEDNDSFYYDGKKLPLFIINTSGNLIYNTTIQVPMHVAAIYPPPLLWETKSIFNNLFKLSLEHTITSAIKSAGTAPLSYPKMTSRPPNRDVTNQALYTFLNTHNNRSRIMPKDSSSPSVPIATPEAPPAIDPLRILRRDPSAKSAFFRVTPTPRSDSALVLSGSMAVL